MANVFDVARYILNKNGKAMTAMKLEKLCYYAQVWHCVWEEQPLFLDKIEAWENGPVIPDLYKWHKGLFLVEEDKILIDKCENNLKKNEKETINCVLEDYSQYTAQNLSDLTHQEKPWREAYYNHRDVSGRCNAEISLASIHEYYSGLQEQNG